MKSGSSLFHKIQAPANCLNLLLLAKKITDCHGLLIYLLLTLLVRHVTKWARAARCVATVDVETACCTHGVVLLAE